MIKKEGGKFSLYSKDGKKHLGTFDTEQQAIDREKQIKQIEYLKKHDIKKGAVKANCLANITSLVVNSAIRTETIEGVEFTVLPSKTLPPDIVMNGGLYRTEDVKNTIQTLNMTPVTMGHPKVNGKFVDAFDSMAQAKHGLGGAFNKVSGQDDQGRWIVDKYIPTEYLNNMATGKQLKSAIDAGSPIHTSTGVYLNKKPCSGVSTNGQEYDWEAEIIAFNHDAILLNEIGASTPEQGTGLFVNAEGTDEEIEIMTVSVNLSTGDDFTRSAEATRCMLRDAARDLFAKDEDGKEKWCYIEDFNDESAIVCLDEVMFKVGYKITGDKVEFVGDLVEVKRANEYKFGQKIGSIFSKLVSLVKGGEPEDAAEPQGNANQSKTCEGNTVEKEEVVQLISEALTANNAKLAELIDTKLQANTVALQANEKSALVDQIVANGLMPKEAAEGCTMEALKALAINCKKGKDLPRAGFQTNEEDSVRYDLNSIQ